MSRRNWYLLTNSVVLVWITAGLMAVGVHRFVDQPLWLMVHVPLLGAATAAILIWSQHFADTLLRRPALGGRVGLGIRLLGHTVGAALIVVGILAGVPPLAVTGAIGVAAVALGRCDHGQSADRSIGATLPVWPPRTVIRKSAGLRTLVHRAPGLSFDVDFPADYSELPKGAVLLRRIC